MSGVTKAYLTALKNCGHLRTMSLPKDKLERTFRTNQCAGYKVPPEAQEAFDQELQE